MTAIAAELDQKLQTLDPQAATYVEQLVRDALRQAETHLSPATDAKALAEHQAHIAKFAGIWAGDDFERPPQGEFEKREDW
jgi:hypothetical protein